MADRNELLAGPAGRALKSGIENYVMKPTRAIRDNINSLSDVGTLFNKYGAEKIGEVKDLARYVDDTMAMRRKPTMIDELNYQRGGNEMMVRAMQVAGLMTGLGKGGGGPANMGPWAKKATKEMSQAMRRYQAGNRVGGGDAIPDKGFVRDLMKGTHGLTEMEAKSMMKGKTPGEGIAIVSRDNPYNAGSWSHDDRAMYINRNYGDPNMILKMAREEGKGMGFLPTEQMKTTRRGLPGHELGHGVQGGDPLKLPHKKAEMDFNRSLYSLKRASERVAHQSHIERAGAKTSKIPYLDQLGEQQTRGMQEFRGYLKRQVNKAKGKSPEEQPRLLAEADAKFRKLFVQETRKAMSKIKKKYPEEYGIINRTAKGDMHMRYGADWKKDYDRMSFNYNK